MKTNCEKDKSNGLRSLTNWIVELGVTPVTVWRWRRKGWLKTTNIAGRQYVSAAEAERFQQRAEAGEFAKENRPPVAKEASCPK